MSQRARCPSGSLSRMALVTNSPTPAHTIHTSPCRRFRGSASETTVPTYTVDAVCRTDTFEIRVGGKPRHAPAATPTSTVRPAGAAASSQRIFRLLQRTRRRIGGSTIQTFAGTVSEDCGRIASRDRWLPLPLPHPAAKVITQTARRRATTSGIPASFSLLQVALIMRDPRYEPTLRPPRRSFNDDTIHSIRIFRARGVVRALLPTTHHPSGRHRTIRGCVAPSRRT